MFRCSTVQNLFHLMATCSISACVRLLEMICLFTQIILTFWWDNNKMTDVQYKLRKKTAPASIFLQVKLHTRFGKYSLYFSRQKVFFTPPPFTQMALKSTKGQNRLSPQVWSRDISPPFHTFIKENIMNTSLTDNTYLYISFW